MACSDENRGRSRRHGAEDRGWSHAGLLEFVFNFVAGVFVCSLVLVFTVGFHPSLGPSLCLWLWLKGAAALLFLPTAVFLLGSSFPYESSVPGAHLRVRLLPKLSSLDLVFFCVPISS
jgi:hypothetical protein